MPNLLTEDQFVKLAVAKEAVPDDSMVVKSCVAEVEILKGTKEAPAPRYRFKISTAAVDRDKDVINLSGWQLENYKKNPVVLFGHDYRSLPVGKSIVSAGKGSLDAEVTFAPKEMYPFADTVRQMVEGGFLRAASVGFKPQKYLYNEERRGVDIEAAELLEWSIVPVPANPECLVQLSALPMAVVGDYAKHCEEVLEMVKGKGAWVAVGNVPFDVKAVAVELAKALPSIPKEPSEPPAQDAPEAQPEPEKATQDEDVLAGIAFSDEDDATTLKIDDEDEVILPYQMDEIGIMLRDMIVSHVKGTAQQEVERAINYARGRVD